MITTHKIYNINSNNMICIPDKSIQLIVTSPPYPMIEMWDEMFKEQSPVIKDHFDNNDYDLAFEEMHRLLDAIWRECDRVLSDNGFICVNIGDATRTVNESFKMFSNHSRIIQAFINMGYNVLPDILWHKQSNAPNKFMGSGMYPAGAYVTYEHEYILIFRKGGKRVFKGSERFIRQESAYFWEERNIWFSDLWEIRGTSQNISKVNSSRARNASFPLEIPYRLVNMYSVKGDTVLDPFCGLGTTILACMASQRNSIGIEVSKEISELATININENAKVLNNLIKNRIKSHNEFIETLNEEKLQKCYKNTPHGFLVKTKQETALHIKELSNISYDNGNFICDYK